MNRRTLSIATAGLLVLGSAVPVFAADGDPGKLLVMSHACTEQPVRNEADFDAIVAKASGDDVTALALTVLACPTIVLADNEGDRTNGIAGPAVDFKFTLTDSKGDTQTLSDAEFVSAKLCESDIQRDANGDGTFSADVCLDISHYMFSNVAAGKVTLKETSAPNGWKFGTMLLTPKSLQASGSDDAATGADYVARTATVTLDLSADADNSAMLHIYNFEKSPATDTVGADAGNATPAFLRAV